MNIKIQISIIIYSNLENQRQDIPILKRYSNIENFIEMSIPYTSNKITIKNRINLKNIPPCSFEYFERMNDIQIIQISKE